MIVINTVDAKFFTLDGVQFARIYQPLAQGSQAVGIYSIYDTKQQLKNSTKYDEFLIDGVTYASQDEVIVALLGVVYSGVSDYDVEQLENRVENLEENQFSGVVVYSTYAELPNPGTLLVSYKVSNDPNTALNGYYHWMGSAYLKDADLVSNTLDPNNTSDAVSGKAIDVFTTDKFLEVGKNKFNPALAEDNKYYQNGTGNDFLTGNDWSITGKQKVSPSTNYIIWLGFGTFERLHFYDINGVWISELTNSETASHVFTTPSNCYYVATWSIRFNQTFQEWIDSIQLELGAQATSYEPYGVKLKSELASVPENVYNKTETDSNIATAKDEAIVEAVSQSKEYTDLKVTELSEGLPFNLIEGEGTQTPTLLPITSNSFVSEQAVLNDDTPYNEQYEYKRRYTGLAASGSCYLNNGIDFSSKPGIVSHRFWVKDSDIQNIWGVSDNIEFWLYDGGIVSQPKTVIRTLISAIGNTDSGTSSDDPTKFTCDWKFECIAKENGYSCVVLTWYNVVYDAGYNPSTVQFYRIYNNIVASFFGNTIDMFGFVWLFDEEVISSAVYPDAQGKAQFPNSIGGLQNQIDIINEKLETEEKPLILLREGNYIYVRSKFSSSKDLIQRYEVYKNENFFNNCINVSNAYLIDVNAANTSAVYEAGIQISSSGDDSCPNNYNGTYIGANHGLDKLRVVTATGHGKTAVDIGSEWTDGAAVKWYIVRIVDANTLWVLSEDSSVTDIWSFNGTLTGNLTHSSGATHPGTITVSSVSNTQLYPAVKNQVKKVLINGNIEVTEDGITYCEYVDIVDTYDIVNPSSMLDNLIANVGTDYSDNDLHLALKNGDSSVFNQVLNRVQKNGAIEVVYGWRNYQQIDIGYMGFMQAAVLIGYPQVKIYSPKALPINDGVKTYDLRNIEDWTVAPASSLNFTPVYWEVPTSPPERTVMYLADSGGNKKVGFVQGYDLLKGVGNDRDNLVNNALFLYTSRKNYPHGIDDKLGNVAANTWFSCHGYRIFFDAESSDKDSATNLYFYEKGKEVIVVFDYHTTADFDSLKLPAEYVGMNISVVEKSANVTIHTTEVMQDGITVSVSAGAYAYCVLKLD